MKIKEMINKTIILPFIISFLFMILKVTGVADWMSWFTVLSPIIAIPAGVIILIVVTVVILVLAKGVDLTRRR